MRGRFDFTLRSLSLILVFLAASGSAQAVAVDDKTPEDGVRTSFAILVGFPAASSGGSAGVLLVPGTVIPLESEKLAPGFSDKATLVDKSHAFSDAVSKLWSTFRLDPTRRIQKGMRAAAKVGVPLTLPMLEGADVSMTATLIGFNAGSTTFRVVFRQGQKQLADSTVNVARGGRAVVGGTDGDAAPYIFVFVEPEAPGEGNLGGAHADNVPRVTQPVLDHGTPPAYPEEAKKKQIVGTVLVDVLVGTDGKVEDAMAIEYPELSLAQSAVEAIRSWKFQPARDEKGNPLRVKCTIEINFKLR